MSNPIDEALMAKEAFFGSKALKGIAKSRTVDDLRTGATHATGAVALTGAAALAAGGVAKLRGALKKRNDFKDLLETNPDLKEYQEEDPRLFNASFSSLRRLNPTYAQDPLVAGSVMRKMMEVGPSGAGSVLMGTMKTPDARRPFRVGINQSIGPLNFQHDLENV